MAIKGKKLRDHYKNTDRDKLFNLNEAVKLVREFASGGKSDQTIEIAMNLGVDPRHSDQMVRGVWLVYQMVPVRVCVWQFLHATQRRRRQKMRELILLGQRI